MNVAAILSAKGNTVEVVGPDTPVTVAVHRMATRNIGSLVVVGPDDQLVGVVGERDIVRGRRAPRRAVPRPAGARRRQPSVATCTVTDDLAEVMRRMTATRSAPHARARRRPGRRPRSASATSSSTASASSSSRPTSSATSTSPAADRLPESGERQSVAGGEGDGEVVGAEDADGVGLPGDRAVEGEVGHAAGEQRQRLLQLGPGQRGAEAVVDARAERQLRLAGRLAA